MRIAFESVALAYGERRVVDGFSAQVEPSVVTALVGPSGSGKSTLLAAIGGHRRPVAGSITLVDAHGDGHPPSPELVAWVPQGAGVMNRRSVLDNVLIAPLAAGASLADARPIATDALEQVGLADRGESWAGELSGGERQRLAFARAIASTRPVILADEPTSSLDAENTRMVARLLAELARGSTIVVATHDPIVMHAADHVIPVRAEEE